MCHAIVMERRGDMAMWLNKILKIRLEVVFCFLLIQLKMESNLLLQFLSLHSKSQNKMWIQWASHALVFSLWNYGKTQSSNSRTKSVEEVEYFVGNLCGSRRPMMEVKRTCFTRSRESKCSATMYFSKEILHSVLGIPFLEFLLQIFPIYHSVVQPSLSSAIWGLLYLRA